MSRKDPAARARYDREVREARRAGLLPPADPRKPVPDPDDYSHPDSDVRTGP